MLTCWQRNQDDWQIEWGAKVQRERGSSALPEMVMSIVADHASLRIR